MLNFDVFRIKKVSVINRFRFKDSTQLTFHTSENTGIF